jgi:hypothetical protein
MKFSERTLTILKNFATINPSIAFKPGNQIKTISPQKTVMATATIPDEIPSEACIYDMSRFLSTYGLFNDPNVVFEDNRFMIEQGKTKTNYYFADKSMIIAPPEKEVNIPSKDVEVDVEWADIKSVLNAAGVLQLPEIAFVGDGTTCSLKAVDTNNTTGDTFGIELGETKDKFQLTIKTENLKLIPQNYKVTLCSKGISKFEGTDVTYFVAIESKSSNYVKGK